MVTQKGKITERSTPDLQMNQQDKILFFRIDKAMLPYKIHYFFSIGALGAVLPYETVYGESVLHLSSTAIGIIFTAQQFIFVLAKPVVGIIVDYFNKIKSAIIILLILQVILFSLLYHVHYMTAIQTENVLKQMSGYEAGKIHNENNTISEKKALISCACRSGTMCYNASLCKILNANEPENNVSTLEISLYDYNKSIDNNLMMDTSLKLNPISEFKMLKFWLFAILLILTGICFSTLFTVSDTACYEVIKKTGAEYGPQRIWGAIGWAIISPLSGLAFDYTGSYLPGCIISAIFCIIAILNIRKLDLLKAKSSSGIFRDIGKVFKSGEFVAFEISIFINGALVSFIWFYLMLFLQQIGGNRLLIGMTQFVQCIVGELPFMFFSGYIIKKVGHFNCITLSLVGFLIRFSVYSSLHNAWLALTVEACHGLTYGLLYMAITSYGSMHALPGTETTTQAVLSSTYEGIGAGIGVIIAGVGFDHLGGHRSFFWATIVTIIAMAVNVTFTLMFNKRKHTFNVEKASVEKSHARRC